MLWAIRVDKDDNTNKIKRIKLVDTKTFECQIFDIGVIKNVLKNNAGEIANVYIDNNGKLKVSIMTPYERSKSYKVTHINGETLYHYCILIIEKNGKIYYIADDTNNIYGNTVLFNGVSSIKEFADSLGVEEGHLRLFNGYVEKQWDKENVYVYSYTDKTTNEPVFKLMCTIGKNKLNISKWFGKDWDIEGKVINENRLALDYIENTKGLGEANLPEIITSIKEFGGGVNHLILPDSLTSLGEECFNELEDLYSIRLGNGLTEIPNRCFAESRVEKVVFDEAQKIIHSEAFCDCNKLKGIINTAATHIGNRAFYYIKAEEIILPDIVYIGIESFAYNTRLSKVHLGENISRIREGAFRNCTKLEEITIPSSCKSIGSNAFEGCKRLKKVRISRNTKLGKNVFPKGCSIICK